MHRVARTAIGLVVLSAGCASRPADEPRTGSAPGPAPAARAGRDARPNLVVILADDLGWGTPNCYGSDPALLRTPAIDRLAAEGRRFTDANTASSVCTPTRYALLTGRYAWRTSLQLGVLHTTKPLLIEPERPTLASLLRGLGYRTAAVGKWHLGYGRRDPVDFTGDLTPGPAEVGFDDHFGVPANHGDIAGVYVENRRVFGLRSTRLDPAGRRNFNGEPFLGLDAPPREDERVMEVLTDRAVAWLERQEAGTPFFLYFTPVAVHHPITPSPSTPSTSGCGPFGDYVRDLDASVARILEALDRRGLARDTIVLFTSDNGGVTATEGAGADARIHAVSEQAGLRPNGPWRGRKHSVYEGGFRVPFIVRWPGRVPAGTVCDETIGLVDLPATTAALTGAPVPAAGAMEDSFNVLPALLGDAAAPRPLRPDLIVHSAEGNFAVRRGTWKWIEGRPHPKAPRGALKSRAVEFRPQLYDLRADPGEQTDLSARHPEVVQALSARLEECRRLGRSRP